MTTVKKYPVIGGPLDGLYANEKDFYGVWNNTPPYGYIKGSAQFEQHKMDYGRYNAGDRRGKCPSMVYLYVPQLPMVQRMQQNSS